MTLQNGLRALRHKQSRFSALIPKRRCIILVDVNLHSSFIESNPPHHNLFTPSISLLSTLALHQTFISSTRRTSAFRNLSLVLRDIASSAVQQATPILTATIAHHVRGTRASGAWLQASAFLSNL